MIRSTEIFDEDWPWPGHVEIVDINLIRVKIDPRAVGHDRETQRGVS